ncbi:alanine racemase [Novosphingobium sp. KCTC 2891]|uniref:alanine racemase n=1 Tax=Novosphingobium sp. KCTC 2891 TaxID=2989730 RepID=UPI002222A309|nr:alanine racemase [Novosphingobium sp. KCTC 2891]MCW1383382.1 alanine racemase [Novosphingobium sp. KCTC 2891]
METTLPDFLPPSPLRLKLDLEALAANWRALDRMSGAARAGAAVKADAYGLGAALAVPALAAAGCRDWFVAHWQEVPELLRHVPAAQVSVLHGPMNAAEAAFGVETGVRPVLNSLEQVRRWRSAGGGACDVMVDTGMSRLGLRLADLGDTALAGLEIDCVLSHLASADEDVPQNEAQRARFAEVRAALPGRRYSLANSAGIALGDAYHADLTRPGIALYGGIPRAAMERDIRQVAYPEAAVIQVRNLLPGDKVGYNATFTADRPIRAGIVAVGYADGYLRCWSGKGLFRFGDDVLPVLGRVSMDMTIVDLDSAPHCTEGDWLSIAYDPVSAAKVSGLSQYELFTLLGRRFSRVG